MKHTINYKTFPFIFVIFLFSQIFESAHADEQGAQLVTHMGTIQRFSQKLGYSLEAKNKPLVKFYLHEIEEIFEDIEKVSPTYEGHDLLKLSNDLVIPKLKNLKSALKAADWEVALKHYGSLIDGCNSCHNTTGHSFIHIIPASGLSPFNQKFSLD